MYLPVFLVLLVCLCVFLCQGVHRQTNRHSRESSEIVPARTHAHTQVEITCTPLSCGNDECDADSLSLLIHTYIHRGTSMHVCLLSFLSILTAGCHSLSLLLQSYIPTCILFSVGVRMYIFGFVFALFFWVYLTAGCLFLCFSSIQVSCFWKQPVVGPATGHVCRAFIAWVCVCVSRGWVLRYCGWVKVLISYHSLTCIGLCF